jgi:hypothetical protein
LVKEAGGRGQRAEGRRQKAESSGQSVGDESTAFCLLLTQIMFIGFAEKAISSMASRAASRIAGSGLSRRGARA